MPDVPLPLPDELLYSAIARGRRRLGISTYWFCQLLFGSRVVANPLLGCNLSRIAASLQSKAGWISTAEELRDNCTLYRLFAPFLPQQYRTECSRLLLDGGKSGKRFALIYKVLNVKVHSHLRFCEKCRSEDRAKFGESYWHRIHQIDSVAICFHHRVALRLAEVSIDPECYTALDDVGAGTRCLVPRRAYELHLRVAHDAFDLLMSPTDSRDYSATLRTLLRAQLERNSSVSTSTILARDLKQHLSTRLDRNMEMLLSPTSWSTTVLSGRPRAVVAFQIYSLLSEFLGRSLRSIPDHPAEDKLAERGPWPCMNPNCSCFGEPTIVGRKRWWNRSEAAFRCPICGVSYRRARPLCRKRDGTFAYVLMDSDRSQLDERLRTHWPDVSLDWSALSYCLKTCVSTLRYRAARLGLPNVAGRRIDCRRPQGRMPLSHEERLRKHRERWLTHMRKPTATGREQRKAQYSASWLRSYDRDWPELQKAETLIRRPANREKDWSKRDRTLASLVAGMVPSIVEKHKVTTKSPLRMTTLITAIESATGKRFPRHALAKLPKTAEVLRSSIEHFPDCLPRRIVATTRYLVNQRLRVAFWVFRRRCGVRSPEHRPDNVLRSAYERYIHQLDYCPTAEVPSTREAA